MDKHKTDELKKRAAAGAAAALASASLVVGGLFQSPADLLDEPVDSYISSVPDLPDDDLDGSEDDTLPDEKKKSISSRLRARLLALPLAVRAVVFLPLWVIGCGLIGIGSTLWGGVLSPAVSAALRWVCIAAVMLLALCAGVKALFPSVPIRRILSRRTVTTAVIGMLVVGALEIILGVLLPDRENLVRLITLLSSTCVMLAAGIPIIFTAAEDKALSEKREPDAELATRRLTEEIISTCK